MGGIHARAYGSVPWIFPNAVAQPDLRVVADARLEDAEAFARRFGIPEWTDDWRSLLDRSGPGADRRLHAAGPAPAHRDGRRRRRQDLYCEKPVGRGLDETHGDLGGGPRGRRLELRRFQLPDGAGRDAGPRDDLRRPHRRDSPGEGLLPHQLRLRPRRRCPGAGASARRRPAPAPSPTSARTSSTWRSTWPARSRASAAPPRRSSPSATIRPVRALRPPRHRQRRRLRRAGRVRERRHRRLRRAAACRSGSRGELDFDVVGTARRAYAGTSAA